MNNRHKSRLLRASDHNLLELGRGSERLLTRMLETGMKVAAVEGYSKMLTRARLRSAEPFLVQADAEVII